VSTTCRAERRALVEPEGELPVSVQCELVGVSRSSLYYRPVGPSALELALKHRIDELYTAFPFYGSRRMTVALQQEGYAVNRKRIQAYMREMAIWGVAPGPHLSARRQESGVFPYLLGGLEIVRPNQVWGVDLTYIRLRGGWLYLVAVLDWYSRYVLAWELDQTLAMGFVLAAMRRALCQATPEICNSDQGSQFTSPQWGALLQQAQVRPSMNGKGRALDNCFVERLWRSVKYEEVYLHDYASPREARRGLARYFDYYNHQRPHQALRYCTPAQVHLAPAGAAPHGGREQHLLRATTHGPHQD
jgi:putative transposase